MQTLMSSSTPIVNEGQANPLTRGDLRRLVILTREAQAVIRTNDFC